MIEMSRSHAVDAAAAALARRVPEPPEVALVLGSGLGAFADALSEPVAIDYAQVEGMSGSSVVGHAGRFVCGRWGALRVAAMQGRVHLYEGHSPDRVVLGLRALIRRGARTVVLTNAAGGIRDGLDPGSLMVIEDHLNLTGASCLVGPNDEALGPRFPAMNDAYDPALRALAHEVAERNGLRLASGVYAGLLGPAYETPAEVRMLRALGADAVGMSTVLEALAARHMGACCLGISCITNRAAGLSSTPPSHSEVEATAGATRAALKLLLSGILDGLAREVVP
jgi:purine-nucleoside phosphorylase